MTTPLHPKELVIGGVHSNVPIGCFYIELRHEGTSTIPTDHMDNIVGCDNCTAKINGWIDATIDQIILRH